MSVFAIDPGTTRSAFVIWDGAKITDHGILPNDDLLQHLRQDDLPGACVIEMIASYGMDVGAEVFETCVLIGALIEIWRTRDVSADRLTRIEVKSHLCHSARAKDANVRQALIDRLGPPGGKKSPGVTYGLAGDEWQALALALTWWDKKHAPERPWQPERIVRM